MGGFVCPGDDAVDAAAGLALGADKPQALDGRLVGDARGVLQRGAHTLMCRAR